MYVYFCFLIDVSNERDQIQWLWGGLGGAEMIRISSVYIMNLSDGERLGMLVVGYKGCCLY